MLSKRKLISQLPFREVATSAGNAAGPPRRLCVGLLRRLRLLEQASRDTWRVFYAWDPVIGKQSSFLLPGWMPFGWVLWDAHAACVCTESPLVLLYLCDPPLSKLTSRPQPARSHPSATENVPFLLEVARHPGCLGVPHAVQPRGFPAAEVMAHCRRPQAAPRSPVSVVGVGVGTGGTGLRPGCGHSGGGALLGSSACGSRV